MTSFFSKNKRNDDDQYVIGEEMNNSDYQNNIEQQNSAITENNVAYDESADGQLSVDVYQDRENLIIKSTIAGVKPENIDIAIDNDVLTVRGERKMEEKIENEDYFYQECYWGNFSRSIVLPVEVKPDEVEASIKNGVLTIILPKARKNKSIAVKVKSE